MALSCVCWPAAYLEKSTFGGFFLCAACDFHLSTCGALSHKEIHTKKGNYRHVWWKIKSDSTFREEKVLWFGVIQCDTTVRTYWFLVGFL